MMVKVIWGRGVSPALNTVGGWAVKEDPCIVFHALVCEISGMLRPVETLHYNAETSAPGALVSTLVPHPPLSALQMD